MLRDELLFNKGNDWIVGLKKERLPIVLWGAGNVALAVKHYLENREIKIDYVIVDSEYYSEELYFEGIKVYTLECLEKMVNAFVVVMGMACYIRGRELDTHACCKKVYYCTNTAYGFGDILSEKVYQDHREEYQEIYQLLADDMSRKCMSAWLNCRINDDAEMIFDCYEGEQNYFKNSVYAISEGENYMDIGAFWGDSIEQYYYILNGNIGHVWAFEGEKASYNDLLKTIEKLNIEKQVECYNKVLWEKDGYISFKNDQTNIEESLVLEKGNAGNKVWAEKIDSLLIQKKHKVDLIKVNFPGGLSVLRGTEKIISMDKPKIAITIGWNFTDIIDVPQWLLSINANYKIYIRFNSCIPAKICLYVME